VLSTHHFAPSRAFTRIFVLTEPKVSVLPKIQCQQRTRSSMCYSVQVVSWTGFKVLLCRVLFDDVELENRIGSLLETVECCRQETVQTLFCQLPSQNWVACKKERRLCRPNQTRSCSCECQRFPHNLTTHSSLTGLSCKQATASNTTVGLLAISSAPEIRFPAHRPLLSFCLLTSWAIFLLPCAKSTIAGSKRASLSYP
jgi:hypothetical protein